MTCFPKSIIEEVSKAAVPNFFERDQNLHWLNTLRLMSQTTYEKKNHCMDDF